MQKLEPRDTYTPTNAPQVRGNCGLALNREETLSVSSLKTDPNTSENIEKSHINDAFVIAGGTDQTRAKPYTVKQNIKYIAKEYNYAKSLRGP